MELTTQRFLFEGWNGRGWFFYNEIGQFIYLINPLNGKTSKHFYLPERCLFYTKLHKAILKNCNKLNEIKTLLSGDRDCRTLALLLLDIDPDIYPTPVTIYNILTNLI